MEEDVLKDATWLEEHLGSLDRPTPENLILELGCGEGRDTEFLASRGFSVTATDISEERLKVCEQNVTGATCQLLDLRQPLPFADKTFSTVLASLCLHYFEWDKTQQIVGGIWRCIKPGGRVIARVNSVNDVNYGAVGFKEISANFYDVLGKRKRFFNSDMLSGLFSVGWYIEQLEERTIDRYGKPKVIWQLVARRSAL